MPRTSTVTRKDLLAVALGTGRTVSRVEIKEVTLGPLQHVPLHLHPCPVVGLVTEGEIAFQIEGEGVRYLKAGDAFHEPAGVRVARFDNAGAAPARFVAFYLLGEEQDEIIRMLAP
ncbi:MAG: cupin domain-containing protein [Nevskia sp.]|nr:cupin domain-containing protein [Nevskia sp.]